MSKSESTSWIRRLMPSLMLPSFLLCMGLITLVGYRSAEQRTRAVDMEFRRQLLRNATDLGATIDIEQARALTFTPEDFDQPAYHAVREQMLDYVSLLPHRGAFSISRRDGILYFGPETHPPDSPLATAPGTPYRHPPEACLTVFETRRPVVIGPLEDEHGTFVTALAPVLDPRTRELLMVIGFDVPADDWLAFMQATKRPVYVRVAILLALMLVGGLLLRHKHGLPEERQGPWRHLEVALVILYGLAFSIALSMWITDTEIRERRSIFTHLVEMHAEMLRDGFKHVEIKFDAVVSLFEASEYVDAQEFAGFTAPMLRQLDIRALGWIPELTPDRASSVLQPPGESEPRSIPLWEWDETGVRRTIEDPSRSWPTLFVQPPTEKPAFIGFNHASLPAFESVVVDALRAAPNRTVSIRLSWPPMADKPRPYYFLYRAVRSQSGLQDGVALAVIELRSILNSAFENLSYEAAYVEARFAEIEKGVRKHTVIHPTEGLDARSVSPAQFAFQSGLPFIQPVVALGRTFELAAAPTPAFFETYPARSGRIVGLAGVVLTLLVAGFIGRMRQRIYTEELVRSEKRYRELFSSMSSGFMLCEILVDTDGAPEDFRFLEMNEAFEGHTGFRVDELIGRLASEALPHIEPIWTARYGEVALTGKPTRFTHFEPSLNRHFEVAAYAPQHGQCAVIFTDVTARKRIEEQLARREAFQHLLMQMATRFINIPSEQIEEATQNALEEIGRFTRADRAYQFRYDFDRDIMINTHEWCASGVTPEIENLQAVPCAADPDWVMAHKRGELYHLSHVSQLDPDHPMREILDHQQIKSLITIPLMAGKDCIGFIGFDAVRKSRTWSDDETALLKVLAQLLANAYMRQVAEEEKILLERQVQQSQKLESLGLLAGGIAHDFNNILTTILGNADLALQDISPVSPARESLQDIETGARRAADLCRQMLAYAGKGRILIESFSLNEVINEMLHLLKTSVTKAARFNLHLAESLPLTRGDASQIRQIILNLVLNASESLGGNSGIIYVRTGVEECTAADLAAGGLDADMAEGTYVTLEVTDTGCGMDPQTLSRIFDPFFSTKFTGRGLGLAAVMGIVRGHKGALQVISTPRKGSTFKLYLPASKHADAPDVRKKAPDNGTNWKGSGTLLFVDDEPSLCLLGRRILERFGYSVLTAKDGEEAMEVYRTHQADIRGVILDLTMPRKSGEETLVELKALKSDLPVILASGYSKQDLSDRLKVKGFSAFIQKPYNTRNLKETLIKVLEESDVRRET